MARVSIFLVTVALIAGMVGCDGDGSQNLEIRTWYDLDAVRDNLDGNHILMNDLNSTTAGYTNLASETANGGKGWEPIGTLGNSFTGTFDGQEYQIEDLFINRPIEDKVGLFGIVDEGGHIEDVGVVNADVTGDWEVASLVGVNDGGTVSNSYSSGSVSGREDVGSLVGVNGGTVANSYSSANVTGQESVGGLVGYNGGYGHESTVSNSYSTGNVSGNDEVGGLVGDNSEYGTVSDSYSSGNVTGIHGLGGLVGVNDGGTVSNSYSTGSVSGDGYAGGLVGVNGGTVSNSYYNYDEILINGENIITIGALFGEDFDEWLANDKFLDINERLSQESGYYVVNNITDFKELLAFGQDNSLKFRLKNDLDLATEPNFYIPYFAGEFDGNGHKISNLSFNFDFVYNVGLFGYLAPSGRVSRVGAENVNITSDSLVLVGGLVGHNREGTVSYCYATGNVAGNYKYVGGLVGLNGGTVSNSYSTSNVTGDTKAGGLVGVNDGGTVSNSYSTGNVTGYMYVGGLVGYNEYGTVSNSFWDRETSGMEVSDGGTGKNTTEMQDITTFSEASWDIVLAPDPTHVWNIYDGVTYPFLSWQS